MKLPFSSIVDQFKGMQNWDSPKVIYEDTHILGVVKPSGMVVNKAVSAKGFTLQDWLALEYPIATKRTVSAIEEKDARQRKDWETVNRYLFHDRNGIVHRLDKETSGVMVVARTEEAYLDLLEQFRDRDVEKTYVALVHGKLAESEGIIEATVGRLPWNRMRFGVIHGGRGSITRFKVIDVWENVEIDGVREAQSFSFVEFYPETGRTHQIRIHAQYLGNPIVGDIYAGRKTVRKDLEWCGRLLLHAMKLDIRHPVLQTRMVLEKTIL